MSDDGRLWLEIEGPDASAQPANKQRGVLVPIPGGDRYAFWVDGADAPQMTVSFVRSGEPGTDVTHLSMMQRLYLRS
jgi:hypothetical protein